MIVIDASVFVHLIMATDAANSIRTRLQKEITWVAAAHIDLEVMNAIRRKLNSRDLTAERAEMALKTFFGFRISRLSTDALRWKIWNSRHNMTSYDAAYVALAQELDAVFVTCDARLYRACDENSKCELLEMD